MKFFFPLVLFLSVLSLTSPGQGNIKGPFKLSSNIYPGTVRDYWVYVPEDYDASKATCVIIVQDGLSRATGWRLPQVMDSLIARKQIPVMLGVFVDHGSVNAADGEAYPRYNRSFEYDAMGDRYANFLLDELLPELNKSYNISKDPNDRALAGASSGAICAFNAAWERPDQFSRVLSTIGTYVGLRGADEFQTLVRKTEAKPIRVFLEDGDHDLNIYAGDWWAANQSMLSALTYAGYEVNHSWGKGGHDSKHAASIMGEAMAWLWKDYPKRVTTHAGTEARINLLIDGEGWKQVSVDNQKISQFTVDAAGRILFGDRDVIYRIDHGVTSVVKTLKGVSSVLTASHDVLYAYIKASGKIVSIDHAGVVRDLISHVSASSMCATVSTLYFSDGAHQRIGAIDLKSKSVTYLTTDFAPTGLAVSAEKTFLNIGASDSPFGYSAKINIDGKLSDLQPYTHFHIPYGKVSPSVTGMTTDSQNLLYAASASGIQVADQLGRVNFIFNKVCTVIDDVRFGGSNFDHLIIAGDGKLFMRRINAKGTTTFGSAVRPPRPGL